MNTFKWLLKREYWEHRGGLFWAPVVTSAIFVFFSIVGLVIAGLGLRQFNDGDAELGFYKLYYQMLVHWLQAGHSYHIYLDWQQNQAQNRFHDLATVLTTKLRNKATIACLEPVTSSNLPLLGLADVLIGAVGYAWNGLGNSAAKLRVVDLVAESAGLGTLARGTPLTAQKVNIFCFDGGARG